MPKYSVNDTDGSEPSSYNQIGKARVTELDTIWDDLKNGIEQVYKRKNQGMSKIRYMELYT